MYAVRGGGHPGRASHVLFLMPEMGALPDEETRHMTKLPEPFRRFTRQNPAVAKAYEALGEACAQAGPLDASMRELVKLGMAIGARLEGAVHSHVRRALQAGVTAEQIRHVVALAAPTLGFPTTIAVSTWVDDVLGKTRAR